MRRLRPTRLVEGRPWGRAPGYTPLLVLGSALALACAGEQLDSPARVHAAALFEGEAALAEGGFEVAEGAFREALKAVPHEPRALHGLARSLLEQGDAESALSVLQELEEYHGGYARRRAGADRCRALEAVARGRLAKGDSRRALSAARALSPASCEPAGSTRLLWQSLLAEARRERGEQRIDEAIALFRAAAEADSSQPAAFSEAAALLLEAGRRDQALELLSVALVEHPGHRGLLDLMVEALTGP